MLPSSTCIETFLWALEYVAWWRRTSIWATFLWSYDFLTTLFITRYTNSRVHANNVYCNHTLVDSLIYCFSCECCYIRWKPHSINTILHLCGRWYCILSCNQGIGIVYPRKITQCHINYLLEWNKQINYDLIIKFISNNIRDDFRLVTYYCRTWDRI